MQANNMVLTKCRALGKAWFSVLGCAVLGAAVGATATGLYGALHGTLDGLIYGDLWRRLDSAGPYFALCGAVAGAMVGGFVRMIDAEGVADLTSRLPKDTGQRYAAFLRQSMVAIPLITRWDVSRRVLGKRPHA